MVSLKAWLQDNRSQLQGVISSDRSEDSVWKFITLLLLYNLLTTEIAVKVSVSCSVMSDSLRPHGL